MDPLPYALLSAWRLGADWGSSPVPCRCCHLWVGLEGRAREAQSPDDASFLGLCNGDGYILTEFSFWGSGRRRPEGTVGAHFSVHGFLGNSIGEGMEAFAGDPETVQQDGELASDGDQGAAEGSADPFGVGAVLDGHARAAPRGGLFGDGFGAGAYAVAPGDIRRPC